MTDISVADVDDLSKAGWTHLSDEKKQQLVEMAQRAMDQQLSQRTALFSTFEGDRADATRLLAAHLFELAEGGEANSESAGGGTTNYNTVTGEWQNSLSETRYGRMLSSLYLRNRQGVGMVTTR